MTLIWNLPNLPANENSSPKNYIVFGISYSIQPGLAGIILSSDYARQLIEETEYFNTETGIRVLSPTVFFREIERKSITATVVSSSEIDVLNVPEEEYVLMENGTILFIYWSNSPEEFHSLTYHYVISKINTSESTGRYKVLPLNAPLPDPGETSTYGFYTFLGQDSTLGLKDGPSMITGNGLALASYTFCVANSSYLGVPYLSCFNFSYYDEPGSYGSNGKIRIGTSLMRSVKVRKDWSAAPAIPEGSVLSDVLYIDGNVYLQNIGYPHPPRFRRLALNDYPNYTGTKDVIDLGRYATRTSIRGVPSFEAQIDSELTYINGEFVKFKPMNPLTDINGLVTVRSRGSEGNSILRVKDPYGSTGPSNFACMFSISASLYTTLEPDIAARSVFGFNAIIRATDGTASQNAIKLLFETGDKNIGYTRGLKQFGLTSVSIIHFKRDQSNPNMDISVYFQVAESGSPAYPYTEVALDNGKVTIHCLDLNYD